jgi:hypothetical protein
MHEGSHSTHNRSHKYGLLTRAALSTEWPFGRKIIHVCSACTYCLDWMRRRTCVNAFPPAMRVLSLHCTLQWAIKRIFLVVFTALASETARRYFSACLLRSVRICILSWGKQSLFLISLWARTNYPSPGWNLTGKCTRPIMVCWNIPYVLAFSLYSF